MKKLLLAGFAVALAIAFGTVSAQADGSFAETPTESPIPDLTEEAIDALMIRVLGPGGSLGSPSGFSPDICFVNDTGEVECLFTLRRESPPEAYRLYWDGVYFQYVEGDEWCNSQIKRGGRYSVSPGCVWGTGHVYTLVVTIGVSGDVDAEYTHERQIWYLGLDSEGVPQYGPVGGDQGIIALSDECRAALREWRESGKAGPVPECRTRRWYKGEGPLVPMD